MRALGAARWVLASTSIMALAAIFAPERAYASCTFNTPGQGVIALSGDICSAAGGSTYTGVPPGDVAFSASSGGVITSTAAGVIIATPVVANAYGVYANGGQINLTAGMADVQTGGDTAYDLLRQQRRCDHVRRRENQDHRRRRVRPLCERRGLDNHGDRGPRPS